MSIIMHWIDEAGIQEFNRKLALSTIEELNLTEYEIRSDLNNDLIMSVWDSKNSPTAFASINLTRGLIEELDDGKVIIDKYSVSEFKGDEYITDDTNYSERIEELYKIQKELKDDRTRNQDVDGCYESNIS